tara:strand:- start:1204 stop:1761 length:558 start_codon:yes stop_codon:yes gene_type:complete
MAEPMIHVNYKWDFEEAEAAVAIMNKEAAAIMGKGIASIIEQEMRTTIKMIKSAQRVRGDIYETVSDSLITEEGHRGQTTEIRFGSDPIEKGGAEGSRGGKIAQILQYGMRSHAYNFDGLKITNSKHMGFGQNNEGFINALRKSGTHPGVKPVPSEGWLTSTQNRAAPRLESAIMEALNKAWEVR